MKLKKKDYEQFSFFFVLLKNMNLKQDIIWLMGGLGVGANGRSAG